MPPWAWAAIAALVQIIFVGLIVAIRSADQARIVKIEQWIKDKEKFDHEFRHDEYARAITDINLAMLSTKISIGQLEKILDDLRRWKHDVGETYLPRAVDDHERRLNRLDTKVFNGIPLQK